MHQMIRTVVSVLESGPAMSYVSGFAHRKPGIVAHESARWGHLDARGPQWCFFLSGAPVGYRGCSARAAGSDIEMGHDPYSCR